MTTGDDDADDPNSKNQILNSENHFLESENHFPNSESHVNDNPKGLDLKDSENVENGPDSSEGNPETDFGGKKSGHDKGSDIIMDIYEELKIKKSKEDDMVTMAVLMMWMAWMVMAVTVTTDVTELGIAGGSKSGGELELDINPLGGGGKEESRASGGVGRKVVGLKRGKAKMRRCITLYSGSHHNVMPRRG